MRKFKKVASRSLLGGVLALAALGIVEAPANASVVNSPGYFHFANVQSDLCVDLGPTGQTPLIQHACHNSTVEEWRLNQVASDTYQIVNHASGECAALQQQSGLNGDTVGEAPCAASLSQYWVLSDLSQADRWLQNREFNQCMQIPSGNTTDGAAIQVAQCNFNLPSGTNQVWAPVAAGWTGA